MSIKLINKIWINKSNGWIAIIVYFEDDPEFDKIRKFPEGCQWAKIMQPGYSLEPMAVSEEQHILLVHIDNIPEFFKEIAGHPRLIPPRTLEQKKETLRKCKQQRKLTTAAQDFAIFSTSGVFPKHLQCDCGKTYKTDTGFQNHIATCPHIKKGLRSSQQLLIKSLGMSATSCKDHRIRWIELMRELKAMHLPPSDLDVNSFIKKDQQPRVNSFIKEQQQERVD